MKKIVGIILLIILSGLIFFLGFSNERVEEPNSFYQVYLNDEKMGVVKSKTALEKYIDKKGNEYKKQYKVDRVYVPNGVKIIKLSTYNAKVDSVDKVYKNIVSKSPLTIKGYQISFISKENTQKIYVINKKIMDSALEEMLIIFVGKDRYQKFVTNNQKEIQTTGNIIEDAYIATEKTIKETFIPVTEKIYINQKELSQFLLFGPDMKKTDYIVQGGDTIRSIAFDNKISSEEFLISNPSFNNENSLLYPGQKVTISATNPQIKINQIEYEVFERENLFSTEIKYDPNINKGYEELIQNGENGYDRISQKVIKENGVILRVENVVREELKPSISRIILKGDKNVPYIGDPGVWNWPTASGWSITEAYGYRINPVTGAREYHGAIDIAGTGYGSPIYAANNGVVETATYTWDFGNYILINHNNGFYTLYSHLAKMNVNVGQIVERGQYIGSMGMSGLATGVHLHFEVWYGGRYQRIDPWRIFK